MKSIIIVLSLLAICQGDVSHLPLEYSLSEKTTTLPPPPPPRPYNFQYQAGRFPGHVDRIHQESGDGSGVIHGTYSFIDPKYKVRTVEYTADKNGFRPSLINYDDTLAQPVDSEVVSLARQKHFRLYERIANANAHGAPANLPRDSPSVANARDKHLKLFDRIAQEHAAIASEREAERLAYEATSVANDVNNQAIY